MSASAFSRAQVEPGRVVPYATLLLSMLTAVVSGYVAIDISGELFGRVRIFELEGYGGVSLPHLRDFELWRLAVSQLLHVKQMHMMFNVASMLVLGIAIERHFGGVRVLLLWLFAGSAATLFSTLFGSPPWNLGTGASQAVMGFAGSGLFLFVTGIDRSRFLVVALVFACAPALALDLVYAGLPKPGHLAGVLLGALMAWMFSRGAAIDCWRPSP